jgi:uncharacterized Zn-binding protein involved in type VI secretion
MKISVLIAFILVLSNVVYAANPVCTVGDTALVTCLCTPYQGQQMLATVITGSPTTLECGKSVARVGDTVASSCGNAVIVTGSSGRTADGITVATNGDSVQGSCIVGTLTCNCIPDDVPEFPVYSSIAAVLAIAVILFAMKNK